MSKPILPPSAELMRLLREAYRLYAEALWNATPTQKLAWHLVDRSNFVEAAGLMTAETREVVSIALQRICEFGVPDDHALTFARRSLAAKRRWRRERSFDS